MAERKFDWPKQGTTSLLGKDVQRTDGVAKASGHAKYSADMNTQGTLFARILTNPHGHAKIAKLNVEPRQSTSSAMSAPRCGGRAS
jgi:xanthine dehydrogenase YagR molybdenum-binding subunit